MHAADPDAPAPGTGVRAWAVEGIGEVTEGADLAELLDDVDLADGDVVLVTSKVVSKAEGRVRTGDREEAIDTEAVRLVARRGATRIVENRLGLVMAAAGVDASNVAPGTVVLLPVDPDASAGALRARLHARRDVNVAVLVTDTAGRAWREGQVDIAVGVAGLEPVTDLAGRTDPHGNQLAVTAPAVADELAGLAEIVTGKLGLRPVSVVRGLGALVLPPGQDGPGAAALLRPRAQDMFALGTREAVLAAVAGTDPDCFGAPAQPDAVVAALAACGLEAHVVGVSVRVAVPEAEPALQAVAAERARLVAHAHGWRPHSDTAPGAVILSPLPNP